MTEKDSPKIPELTREQEEALVSRIRDLTPLLTKREDMGGSVGGFKIAEGEYLSLFRSTQKDSEENPLASTVVIDTSTSDVEGMGRQDTYLISRTNLVNTEVLFDRMYWRLVWDDDGSPFIEQFPSKNRQMRMLAAQMDESESRRLHTEATDQQRTSLEEAQLAGFDNEGFNLDRYEELMRYLSRANEGNLRPPLASDGQT